jgi:chitin synthase
MVAAFLEWFLWLAAFMYCLVKVYQKAEHWSAKILAITIAIIFTLLRKGSELSTVAGKY